MNCKSIDSTSKLSEEDVLRMGAEVNARLARRFAAYCEAHKKEKA